MLPENLKKRVNPVDRPYIRYKTGIPSFDVWTGGLPRGFIVFVGAAGSGKTLMARAIAAKAKRALYFTCEVGMDAPPHSQFRNVDRIDYTKYKSKAKNAIMELKTYIDELKPDIVVIDSVTSFFSLGAMLPETQTRIYVWELHGTYDNVLPIIGISELRGSGFYEHAAGGRGVDHGNSMLVRFEHNIIRFDNQAALYNAKPGDNVYSLFVEKDKQGLAKTEPGIITLNGDMYNPVVSSTKREPIKLDRRFEDEPKKVKDFLSSPSKKIKSFI